MQIWWVMIEDPYLSRANQKYLFKKAGWVLAQASSQGLESSLRCHNMPIPLYPRQHQTQMLLTRIKALTQSGNLQLWRKEHNLWLLLFKTEHSRDYWHRKPLWKIFTKWLDLQVTSPLITSKVDLLGCIQVHASLNINLLKMLTIIDLRWLNCPRSTLKWRKNHALIMTRVWNWRSTILLLLKGPTTSITTP